MRAIAHFLTSKRLSFMEVCLVIGTLEAIRSQMIMFAVCWAAGATIVYVGLLSLNRNNDIK